MESSSMKMVSGALLLLAAEQAFAHAHLVQFPNQDVAARVLLPACIVLLVLGGLLLGWGVLTEARTGRGPGG
jgi:methionine-rich copper-binding protein CopC